MAEIIDLDFYRKFRIILPIRQDIARQPIPRKDKPHGHQTKYFRRKKKVDLDSKVKKKD